MASMTTTARIVLKDVMLDHYLTMGDPRGVECSCGAWLDDFDQYVSHLTRRQADAIEAGRNPSAPVGRLTVRDAALL